MPGMEVWWLERKHGPMGPYKVGGFGMFPMYPEDVESSDFDPSLAEVHILKENTTAIDWSCYSDSLYSTRQAAEEAART